VSRELAILDWKSGKNVLDKKFEGYGEHKLQVAAYIECENIKRLPGGLPLVTAGGDVYLDKETGAHRFIDATEKWEDNYRAFLNLRQYYGLIEEPKSAGRRYYPYEGDAFPSVTTILGVLDKPALLYWAANSAVEAIAENLAELRDPATTDMRIQMILGDAKKNFRKKSKDACDIGTLIHDAIQIHLAGGDPSKILDGKDAAQNGFLAFLQWADRVKLEPVGLEVKLYNPPMRYAGTCDFLGWVDMEAARGCSHAA
jgi:hypothetical protein